MEQVLTVLGGAVIGGIVSYAVAHLNRSEAREGRAFDEAVRLMAELRTEMDRRDARCDERIAEIAQRLVSVERKAEEAHAIANGEKK